MFTLTYVYRDSTAVLGPLATYAEPHCYDLCAEHSERLTAPMGWELVRLPVEDEPSRARTTWRPSPTRSARPRRPPAAPETEPVGQGTEVGRRGHLRVLRSEPAATQPGQE